MTGAGGIAGGPVAAGAGFLGSRALKTFGAGVGAEALERGGLMLRGVGTGLRRGVAPGAGLLAPPLLRRPE